MLKTFFSRITSRQSSFVISSLKLALSTSIDSLVTRDTRASCASKWRPNRTADSAALVASSFIATLSPVTAFCRGLPFSYGLIERARGE